MLPGLQRPLWNFTSSIWTHWTLSLLYFNSSIGLQLVYEDCLGSSSFIGAPVEFSSFIGTSRTLARIDGLPDFEGSLDFNSIIKAPWTGQQLVYEKFLDFSSSTGTGLHPIREHSMDLSLYMRTSLALPHLWGLRTSVRLLRIPPI